MHLLIRGFLLSSGRLMLAKEYARGFLLNARGGMVYDFGVIYYSVSLYSIKSTLMCE
jgi:hypothetical protein